MFVTSVLQAEQGKAWGAYYMQKLQKSTGTTSKTVTMRVCGSV